MTDITNIKDPQANPGAGENLPPDTQEVKINSGPSEDITQLIGSLGKPDTENFPKTSEIPAEQPKRRGRPKGSGRKVAAKAVKKGRPSKRPVKREIPIEIDDELREVSEIDEAPRRRYLPTSLTNLLLFAAIFAILAAAQVGINVEKDNKAPLVVSPIEFTQEEEPQVVEVPVAEETMEAGSTTVTEREVPPSPSQIQVPEQATSLSPEGRGNTEGVEAPKVEEVAKVEAEAEAPKVEEVAKVEPKEAAKVEVKEDVIAKTKAKSKSVSKSGTKQKKVEKLARGGYYTKDAYTSGGPLDLDGPAAREKYLAGNKIKAQKIIESSQPIPGSDTKMLPKESSADITIPAKSNVQKATRSILDYDEPK